MKPADTAIGVGADVSVGNLTNATAIGGRAIVNASNKVRLGNAFVFAAFGNDGVGKIGTETTINSGDIAGILMIAVQALEKRTAELKETQAQLAAMAAQLEALELRNNHSMQITAAESLSDNL